MASAQADRLTLLHRRDVANVVNATEARVRTVARRANPADIDAWWARNAGVILRLVVPAFAVCAEMAVKYLRSHAALERVMLDPIAGELDREQLTTSLRVMGPVAFKTHMRRSGSEEASLRVMADQLSGAASRRVLDGDRGSVMATYLERDVLVGYRRVLNSPRPCAFCAMLVSRGAVYRTSTATVTGRGGARQVGETYHDRCSCTLVPLYEHEDEPASVLELQAQWEQATAGLSGRDALAAFRRSRTAAATATT